uniref:Uncharacterized protein n=1 Tax=Panagrolaimus superbus TaxID=310955 RepID=A0A914XX63_9BILA
MTLLESALGLIGYSSGLKLTRVRCNCPDNTSGKNCETILSCLDENPCGIDAECIVYKHNKTCQCPPGYTGDAYSTCTLRTKMASLWGDPHFTTFDGTTFNYMGTCPYYLMKACDSSIDFSVQATSTILTKWNYNTLTKSLVFKTQGHDFSVDENMLFYFDNNVANTPYYYPAKLNATVIVTKPSDTVIIQDVITQAVITFKYLINVNVSISTGTVTVPLTPFFYGHNAMCGLFGNIDDICHNDIRASNGTVLTVSNCTIGSNETVASYMDTWVFNSTVNNCIEGQVFFNSTIQSTNCNITLAQQKCDLIRQAIDGLGPFGACEAMGNTTVDKLYHDCTYDICNTQTQCDTLDKFAKLCLITLPFANIDNWRTSTFCPYVCPPYSHYSLKTPTCQKSCSDVNYVNATICQEAYHEGCICDPGYYYDSNGQQEGFEFVCRPLDECGCVGSNGNYFSPNSHWLDANCTTAYQCFDGNLTSVPVSCSINGQCSNISGNPVCECLPGYNGNGYNCSDIDECADSKICSANINQGVCTNLPGTYNCTCFSPYTGPQCTEYTPSRHCADLQLFHGITENGVYSVSIGADYTLELTNDQLNWTQVYCDMENADGGWTLMAHGNNTVGKTYAEYVEGFGDVSNADIWLGLENIHIMSKLTASLRVVIESCPQDNAPIVDCTYESFGITDSSNQYAIFINSTCQSNTNDTTNIPEGWITWTSPLGPSFTAFDTYDPNNCSEQFYKTGWWFNGRSCGHANLNGLHFFCDFVDNDGSKDYGLIWNRNSVKDAHMFLRPKGFPHYDPRYNH